MTYRIESGQKIVFRSISPGVLEVQFFGDWLIASKIPQVEEIILQLSSYSDIKQISFDVSQMAKWDSSFVSFILHFVRVAEKKGILFAADGLPQGVQKLLSLALKKPEVATPAALQPESFLEKVGSTVLQVRVSLLSLLDFLGSIVIAFGRLISGKAFFRWDDFAFIVQRCGAGALFLVSLISLLVGVILAFVGAIQLNVFGAQIYIADIVGIAMVRVMGAVMTGILMSGRTGAAFAAELGIMQVNEEIDALKTIGISPVEFLVMPRVLALLIMMPLLTIYADLMGILGGYVVSVCVLGINPVEYLTHTQTAVKLTYFWVGLIHSVVFAVIISVAGCLYGIKCKRSAQAVGEATTSAVVTAIVSIVIATAIITFVCQVLGV
ncbi:MAG: ABC transporter permease [Candidatus Omnitrophota bacterium]